MQPAAMVIGSPMIPNCPADDTCANTKVISALLALDSTWSTVVKIATKPAPLAGVPVEEQVGRLNSLQTSSRANTLGIPGIVRARLNVEPRGVSSALVITSPSLWKPSQQSSVGSAVAFSLMPFFAGARMTSPPNRAEDDQMPHYRLPGLGVGRHGLATAVAK
jgi:hypothetical protein